MGGNMRDARAARQNMDAQGCHRHLSSTLLGLRKSANLTLEVAAARADVTKGYLSKVERGNSIPSIAVVGRLAEVYGVELSDVFMTPGQKGPFSLVRANERSLMNRNGSEDGYTYEVVGLNKANPRSEVFILTLPCIEDAQLPKLRHPGEEILFVLEGKIRFDFAGTVFFLGPGDCIQFEASYEHLGVAIEGKDAKALLVITPDRHDVEPRLEDKGERKKPQPAPGLRDALVPAFGKDDHRPAATPTKPGVAVTGTRGSPRPVKRRRRPSGSGA